MTPNSSPALSAGVEHLDGTDYAKYLQEVIDTNDIETLTSTHITEVTLTRKGKFRLLSSLGEKWEASALVWATGEYQYPDKNVF